MYSIEFMILKLPPLLVYPSTVFYFMQIITDVGFSNVNVNKVLLESVAWSQLIRCRKLFLGRIPRHLNGRIKIFRGTVCRSKALFELHLSIG